MQFNFASKPSLCTMRLLLPRIIEKNRKRLAWGGCLLRWSRNLCSFFTSVLYLQRYGTYSFNMVFHRIFWTFAKRDCIISWRGTLYLLSTLTSVPQGYGNGFSCKIGTTSCNSLLDIEGKWQRRQGNGSGAYDNVDNRDDDDDYERYCRTRNNPLKDFTILWDVISNAY